MGCNFGTASCFICFSVHVATPSELSFTIMQPWSETGNEVKTEAKVQKERGQTLTLHSNTLPAPEVTNTQGLLCIAPEKRVKGTHDTRLWQGQMIPPSPTPFPQHASNPQLTSVCFPCLPEAFCLYKDTSIIIINSFDLLD